MSTLSYSAAYFSRREVPTTVMGGDDSPIPVRTFGVDSVDFGVVFCQFSGRV